MEEQKKTMEDLQKEYTRLVCRAGELQYDIANKSKDLQALNESIKAVNLEAARLSRQEAAAEAEKKVSEMPKLELSKEG